MTGEVVEIDVDVAGAERIFLVADDGGNNGAHPFAVWGEPRWLMTDGSEQPLLAGSWTEASAWWGDTPKNRGPAGKALSLNGRSVQGFGAPTKSVIEFAVPAGCERFRASAGWDDSASLTEAAILRFLVFALAEGDKAPAAGLPVPVQNEELGFRGAVRVRDLWQHRDLGQFSREFAPTIAFHGAGLYRVTPLR